MDTNVLSPYVRRAMYSTIKAPFVIAERVIYDYEIIFVKDGTCRIRIDGIDYICRKNSVVFLRPGVPHSLHSIEGVDFVQPHIHFDAVYTKKSSIIPISFKPYEKMSAQERGYISEDAFADVDIPCVFSPEKPALFQKLFFDVIDMYTGTASNVEIKIGMLRLISEVLRQFSGSERRESGTGFAVDSIKSYIDENFRSIITLDMLSEAFYINKFTLMRKFRSAYGVNVIKYYNNKRIEYAKKMLEKTNMSVKEIGELLSFTDAYSFSRFFKNAVGVSPVNYNLSGGSGTGLRRFAPERGETKASLSPQQSRPINYN